MIDIYICEDNAQERDLFQNYIKNAIMLEEWDMHLTLCTDNPRLVLQKSRILKHQAAYFLDIDLGKDMDGFALARELRKTDPRCFLIFITSHSEMSSLTFRYKLEALDFILKDEPDQIEVRVRECLADIVEKMRHLAKSEGKTICINVEKNSIFIDPARVYYFETTPESHRIVLHAEGRTVNFSGLLKDVEKQLDERFFRCHRSYLINLDQIDYVDYANCLVLLKDGSRVLLTERVKKKFGEAVRKRSIQIN